MLYYLLYYSHRYRHLSSGFGKIVVTASHVDVFSGSDLMSLWSGSAVRSLMSTNSIFLTVLFQRCFTMTCSTTTSMVSSLSSSTPPTTVVKFHLHCLNHSMHILHLRMLVDVLWCDSVSNMSVQGDVFSGLWVFSCSIIRDISKKNFLGSKNYIPDYVIMAQSCVCYGSCNS